MTVGGRARRTWRSLAVAAALAAGFSGPAAAATLWVANDGQDSDSCGTQKRPCRSISRAIARAATRDTIKVKPGRYGDLNGDGVFGGPGEETAPAGCECMIHVTKRLRLQSTNGALVTILDASGHGLDVVRIEAADVVFGREDHGFTLTGSVQGGPAPTPLSNGAAGLRVAGNASRLEAAGNVTAANSFGVSSGIRPEEPLTEDLVFFRNVALANEAWGLSVVGVRHELNNNVATANLDAGIDVFTSIDVRVWHNLSVANHFGVNFINAGGDPLSESTLFRNAIIGNTSEGVGLRLQTAEIVRNDIFGNGAAAVLYNNCGLVNDVLPAVPFVVSAPENFWGAATGPGPDPADAVCNEGFNTTLVEPVADTEHHVAFPGIR